MEKLELTDIHLHALYGVDDGARSKEEMFEIVGRAYEAGTRYMCVTPHYHPGYYGENAEKSAEHFAELKEYAAEKFPELKLFLGNELHYEKGSKNWVQSGACRTIGGKDYILVDFADSEKESYITEALHRLLNAGYIPILAHVEAYTAIRGKTDLISAYRRDGIVIQMDATSPLGEFGFATKYRSKKLLKMHLVDIISSDAHGAHRRPWRLDDCYRFLVKNYGKGYADKLCCTNGKIFVEGVEN